MILPIMGFFSILIVVGGLGSLVAGADPTRARLFPFTMAMLFSGAAVWIVVLGLGLLPEAPVGHAVTALLFFIGLFAGSTGGAILGFVVGIRRNRLVIPGRHGADEPGTKSQE